MPINKKSRINNVITWLHLWLGLVSGIIVVIVSVTGCLFSFQTEISNLVRQQTYFFASPAAGAKALPMHELIGRAEAVLGASPEYITAYADSGRAWEFMDYEAGDPHAVFFPGTIKSYRSVFLDPYTGAVTGTIDYMHDFFVIVKYIHWSLFLNDRYGQPIVGWGTLLFVVCLLTGFIMWIPKRWNRTERTNSFTVRWKATWKRLNYDLHNVLGFYVVLIALVLGLTGIVYSFAWFSRTVYAVGSWSLKPAESPVFASDTAAFRLADPEDLAFARTRAAYPMAKRYGLNMPQTPGGPIAVTAYRGREVYYDADTRYYDRYTGALLGAETFAGQNNGQKLISMNYDIHVGAIGGLAGKIVAFIVSLICASLPVTGFVIWWGKTKKAPKPATAGRLSKTASRIPV